MSFKEFVDTQFSDGVEIETKKSIYNNQETISIYPSITKLEIGRGYRIHTSGDIYDKLKDNIFNEVKQNVDDTSDVLYLETVIGTFSLSELYPYTHEVKQKEPLIFLQLRQEQIKNIIDKE